ncbi:phosphatidate cytidylyltransferase [Salinispira pacifica]|uniref:Phosphatidate cytidylyltransferase n=1 Tax=Salinispira pacifica TaxID=1307761 RepID=V5WGP3_9SPIO|nr:phosphatidate cytidylyltransferase [Salinispira pacifica]AHC14724.1 Phosphatidate cytidylyltransferase [Salinispira pacifica]
MNTENNTTEHRKPSRNLIQRVILFAVAVPVIILIIFLEADRFHWPLNLVLLLISVPSAFEAARLFGFNPRKSKPRTIGVFLSGLSLPLTSLLWVWGVIRTELLFPVYTGMVMSILFVQVFRQQHKVKKISPGIGKHLATLAYPGLLISHLIMISALPHATILYLTFIAGVFSNDTMAYVGGRLFGAKSSHPVAISPNKTMAGFLIGFLFSPVAVTLVYFLAPHAFPGGLHVAVIMGFLIGFTTIIGDLIESGLKRSAKIKDSGEAIPGRGGLLDSLDSILFTAPVFFYAYQILTGIWVL